MKERKLQKEQTRTSRTNGTTDMATTDEVSFVTSRQTTWRDAGGD